jgi:hypothetical protein
MDLESDSVEAGRGEVGDGGLVVAIHREAQDARLSRHDRAVNAVGTVDHA